MKKLLAVAVAGALLGSVPAHAAVTDAEFAELKAQMAAMAQRLNALEAENNQLREQTTKTDSKLEAAQSDLAVVKQQSEASSWADNIKLKGDFRYRYDDIDEEDEDGRSRDRVRARMAVIAKGPSDTEIGLGLASGNTDPVSTNQTLGSGASTKEINLDLAYATWRPLETASVTAGKYAVPFWLPQGSSLLFDSDLRPEGFAGGYADDLFFANAAYMYIESDDGAADGSEGTYGVQAGMKYAFTDETNLSAAIAYYDLGVEGRVGTYRPNEFYGNSTVINDQGNEVYEYDFALYNAGVQLNTSLFEMPLSLFGDYVYNDDASDFDTGYIAGFSTGMGNVSFLYWYQNLEANAVLGAWTDSDFAGGGTDGEGSKFVLGYALTKAWSLSATYFDTTSGMDLGSDADYKRWQLDTTWKY
jgi:hypothetical protein